MIKVAIVEDDHDIRASLAQLIDDAAGFRCTSTFADGESAVLGLTGGEPPDVVLMDLRLPGISGIETVRRLRALHPALDIIMLTVYKDDELVFESLSAGATGYLVKDTTPARIMEAIAEVNAGGAPMSMSIARRIVDSFRKSGDAALTPRETEVLQHLCGGAGYRTIARALHVSEPTVHFHIKNIYRKLSVHSKSQAVARALRDRLV